MESILRVVGILIGSLCLGWLLRAFLRMTLQRWIEKSAVQWDDRVFRLITRHIIFWSFLAGLLTALEIVQLPGRWEPILRRGTLLVFLISTTLLLANLAGQLVPYTTRRFSVPVAATSFSANLVRLSVFMLGGLLILTNMGIAIGPLLTALGVGSLAVGLALQETLANLFAGFYLFVSRQIDIGDFIEIERGAGYVPHRGYVIDVTWRISRLRTLSNTLIEIPNSFITQSIVRKYERASDRTHVPVDIEVGSRADLTRTEELARKIAGQVLPEGVALERVVMTSGRSPIIMRLILAIPAFLDQDKYISLYIQKLRTQLAVDGLL